MSHKRNKKFNNTPPVLDPALEAKYKKATEKLQDFIAKLIVEEGFTPVALFTEHFLEGNLTKLGEIRLIKSTDKDVEVAQEILKQKGSGIITPDNSGAGRIERIVKEHITTLGK